MATDFSSIANSAAGQSKKPPRLPAANYPAVIKKWEWGDKNKNNTPYARFSLGFTQWPESVPEQWDEFNEDTGKTDVIQKKDIELSSRQMFTDFYVTDDSKYRLDEFLKAMGVNCGTPEAPRSYAETLPELVGQHVLAEVIHQLNQQTNKTYVQVGKLAPLA